MGKAMVQGQFHPVRAYQSQADHPRYHSFRKSNFLSITAVGASRREGLLAALRFLYCDREDRASFLSTLSHLSTPKYFTPSDCFQI